MSIPLQAPYLQLCEVIFWTRVKKDGNTVSRRENTPSGYTVYRLSLHYLPV